MGIGYDVKYAKSLPLIVSKLALIRLYNHSIAGNMAKIDYEGEVTRRGDTVVVLGDGPLVADREFAFKLPISVNNRIMEDRSELETFARKIALKIQCKLDREIYESYECVNEGEFAFAGQLFCTLVQSSDYNDPILTFKFVYGHKPCA